MKNKKTNIESFTEKTTLVAGKSQTIDVLVRLTPPPLEANDEGRPKLNLAIALDRSGSMGGEKMHHAREAAKYCVDQLLSTDVFSAVIFDDAVDVLFTSQPASEKEMLKKGIDRIQARNSTALHEGWVKAGLQVSEHIDQDAINRVLLITDGQANVGETNVDRIVTQAKHLFEKGVSTSTIGIGEDFNEDLLMPMAEAAGGNAWHVQEVGDMQRIFEIELHGLISQIGHHVRLVVTSVPGVRVTDCLNDFELDEAGNYILPNLQAGSPLDIVIRLEVPSYVTGEVGHLASFELSYVDQGSNAPETAKAAFRRAFDTEDVVSKLPENPAVAEAVQLLMNARARREAMDRMDRRDFAGAAHALRSVKSQTEVLFSIMPSPQIREELDELAILEGSLEHREDDVRSRKQMAYGAYNRRKGKS